MLCQDFVGMLCNRWKNQGLESCVKNKNYYANT